MFIGFVILEKINIVCLLNLVFLSVLFDLCYFHLKKSNITTILMMMPCLLFTLLYEDAFGSDFIAPSHLPPQSFNSELGGPRGVPTPSSGLFLPFGCTSTEL